MKEEPKWKYHYNNPMCYWLERYTDEAGIKGYMLTVFDRRGKEGVMSDKWLCTRLAKLKPIVKMLDKKGAKSEETILDKNYNLKK